MVTIPPRVRPRAHPAPTSPRPRRSARGALLAAAAGLLSLAAVPRVAVAQEATGACPLRREWVNHTPPAQRDSLLRALEPREKAVTGFVLDTDGNPVAATLVSIDGSERGTMTAEDGSYLLRYLEREGGLAGSHRPMIRACAPGWEHLTELRELFMASPDGDVVVIGPDGVPSVPRGYAVRVDFVVRRRPSEF